MGPEVSQILLFIPSSEILGSEILKVEFVITLYGVVQRILNLWIMGNYVLYIIMWTYLWEFEKKINTFLPDLKKFWTGNRNTPEKIIIVVLQVL